MKIMLSVNGSWIDENKLHTSTNIVMLHFHSSGGKSSGANLPGANLPGANCPYSVMIGLQSLTPKHRSFLHYDYIESFALLYGRL